MITYLLKSALCLALLLGFYHLVLEREKMHKFNRFYLLGSILFAFFAPAFIIYVEAIPTLTALPETTQEFTTLEFPTTESIVEESINWTVILTSVYILISAIFGIRFIRNLLKIISKIKQNTHVNLKSATLVLVENKILPHSFWNYIFINKNEYDNGVIEEELFTHELTHVTQKHTFDVILIELLQIVFWINPMFILLKKAIQLNHEFLADEKVINQHKNTYQYQHLLLNKAAWNNEYYLASNLNYSLTKKRLKMMTTKSSQAKILLKKLAVIPLLAGFLFLFAERVEAQEIIEIVEESKNVQKTEDTLTSDITNDEIIEVLEDKNPFTANNFLVSVERIGNAINLKCNNCYRWADLEIPLNKEYIITDFGFSDGKNLKNDKYAFKIKATKNNIIFTGLKNTAWKDLRFSLDNENKKFLNQNGMISTKGNKEYIDAPIRKKSSKQSISANLVLDDIKLKLEDVNALKLSLLNESYNTLNNKYEKLRNQKPHFIKSSAERQKELNDLFSKLGSMYFKLSKADKKKVKRPIHPHNPYVRLMKNNIVFYKKRIELTEEDKLLIPPPPIPANASKAQKVKMKKAHSDWKKRTGNDFSTPPPPPPRMVKKGEKSNIPPPPIKAKKSNENCLSFSKYINLTKNEKFNVSCLEDYPNNSLEVFNRWGNSVYSKENYKNNWTGKLKDRKLENGTYYYVFSSSKLKKPIKGWVQLKK